jgi:hypothetical protein
MTQLTCGPTTYDQQRRTQHNGANRAGADSQNTRGTTVVAGQSFGHRSRRELISTLLEWTVRVESPLMPDHLGAVGRCGVRNEQRRAALADIRVIVPEFHADIYDRISSRVGHHELARFVRAADQVLRAGHPVNLRIARFHHEEEIAVRVLVGMHNMVGAVDIHVGGRRCGNRR